MERSAIRIISAVMLLLGIILFFVLFWFPWPGLVFIFLGGTGLLAGASCRTRLKTYMYIILIPSSVAALTYVIFLMMT